MSTLFLGSDPRSLADKLADELDKQAKHGDFFAPALVVVPNRYMRKWLRLWLARRLDVAINLDFQYLEDALWLLLREIDPTSSSTPVEPIDENVYRLMVLAVLLEDGDSHLLPLRRYLQLQGPTLSRLSCRRAWYLADRLGLLLREYEYHRQDTLIQHWLRHEFNLGAAGEFQKLMERAQRSLFLHITREPDGKRALLNRLDDRIFKTFPQYAMELMTRTELPTRPGRTVHFFGFTQVSELHARTLGWLGHFFDVRMYHLNVLASRLPEAPTGETLRTFAAAFSTENDDRDCELLRWWGRAGAESLTLMANLLRTPFSAEVLPRHPAAAGRRTRRAPTVLGRLQDHLLGTPPAKARLIQDTSLQIVGCPGVAREVETVCDSILHNLQNDPSLRQTDIAVLVTDMTKYRAALQAVFERPPRRLQYNLVDFNAAGISMFGQALLGMLDLALESFARSRVFQVILNPCFLARLHVDRAQAMIWLEWAERLGIRQGWDADEKEQQGYARSPFYAWRLGLQRLRLGRYMEIPADTADPSAPRFGHVIPFADLESNDREQLDAFCKAVEGLLPTLAQMRLAPLTGARWAHLLQRLVHEFLDVPVDRPEESQVRDRLLAVLESLPTWDAVHTTQQTGLPLALVREYLLSQLEVLEGNRGEYLVGGVTISALQSMRPVPFQIVYILGLGEDLFPGSNALSTFDLRGAQRLPGDIRPAEHRLYDFLATVLSAQRKLFLLYNNHDLQKDQPLQPAVPLQQLQRYLHRHILKSEFQVTALPAHVDDRRYLDAKLQPAYQDVLVQHGEAERCLALLAAERENRLALDLTQQAEWADKRKSLAVDFSISPEAKAPTTTPWNVTLGELRRFLLLPADASLRRHLRVEEDEEQKVEDEEPLVTPRFAGYTLVRQAIEQLVLAAAQGDLPAALESWPARFVATYADSRLRSQVPEEAFGEIDQASLQRALQERIHGPGAIETFLRERAGLTFCGPVLLGESLTPLGARLRFPALRLRPGHELSADTPREIRIVGWTQFAWQSPTRLEFLVITNSTKSEATKITKPMIEPALLHLALLASTEANADGISARQFLAQRELLIHVSHPGGIHTWTYPPNSIAPAEALGYLVELARDFLDPTQFDLLPYDLLCKNKELERSLDSIVMTQVSPDAFRQVLENAIAEERENTYQPVEIPLLVEMVGATVPADALAKVRRRFLLLDRGPARNRQQPGPGKRKKASTHE